MGERGKQHSSDQQLEHQKAAHAHLAREARWLAHHQVSGFRHDRQHAFADVVQPDAASLQKLAVECLVIVDEGAVDCLKEGKPEPARQGCVIAVGIDGAACNEFLFDARAVAACDLHRAGDCRPADAELQQNLW